MSYNKEKYWVINSTAKYILQQIYYHRYNYISVAFVVGISNYACFANRNITFKIHNSEFIQGLEILFS